MIIIHRFLLVSLRSEWWRSRHGQWCRFCRRGGSTDLGWSSTASYWSLDLPLRSFQTGLWKEACPKAWIQLFYLVSWSSPSHSWRRNTHRGVSCWTCPNLQYHCHPVYSWLIHIDFSTVFLRAWALSLSRPYLQITCPTHSRYHSDGPLLTSLTPVARIYRP